MITLWHNETRPNGAANTVRPLTQLLDLTEKRAAVKATRTCSVEGCDRKYHAHGYCSSHHRRWAATGDPGPAQFEGKASSDRPCREPDCDRPVGKSGARGWCSKHYVRWRVQGDPQKLGYTRGAERSAQLRHGESHAGWVGDDASYWTLHQRIAAQRGKAAAYSCVRCDGQAHEWAYDYTDPNPAVNEKTGGVYSLDVNRYNPMCRSCHRRMDRAQRKAMGLSYGSD